VTEKHIIHPISCKTTVHIRRISLPGDYTLHKSCKWT